MKFKLLAMVALCGVFAVGCKTSGGDTDGSGGGGTGGGGTGGSGNVTVGTTTSGMVGTCDDLGVCEGDGMDPASGCFECSIIGDDTTAVDGGACVEDYLACFGQAGDCSDGNPDCCAFDDCATACPDDDPATATVDENLECLCTPDTTDPTVCAATSMPGTCIGDHPTGTEDYLTFLFCVVGDTGVCAVSCM